MRVCVRGGMPLNEDAILARLAGALHAHDPDFGDDAHLAGSAPLTPAAVLIAIRASRPGFDGGVLLTRRTDTLRNHAGQVSFPGGRIDATDASPEAAALREAAEEVALSATNVRLVGRLPGYVTGTGFGITPVLGLLAPGYTVHPNPGEVAAVFELPLAVLLDPGAPERRQALYKGVERGFWVWPHTEHFIWGATAAMLVRLAGVLREG